MNAHLRTATIDDVELLIKLRFDFFATDDRIISLEQLKQLETSLRNYYKKNIGANFIAALIEDDTNILSTAFLSISEYPANLSFPTGKIGTIFNVFTYPDYRKKGYATMALNALIEEAKRQNLSYIDLSATESGRPVYEKLGFIVKNAPYQTEMILPLL
ncbi:N-acetyltransferase [Clostridia bacterium]|nr:N-acetyltransferase [Clostridia bacterium]